MFFSLNANFLSKRVPIEGTVVSQTFEVLFRGSAKRTSLANIVLEIHSINTLKKFKLSLNQSNLALLVWFFSSSTLPGDSPQAFWRCVFGYKFEFRQSNPFIVILGIYTYF